MMKALFLIPGPKLQYQSFPIMGKYPCAAGIGHFCWARASNISATWLFSYCKLICVYHCKLPLLIFSHYHYCFIPEEEKEWDHLASISDIVMYWYHDLGPGQVGDWVKVGAGGRLLDTLVEEVVWQHIGNVSRVSLAGTTGKHQANNVTVGITNNRPGVPGGRESTILVTPGVDNDLHRCWVKLLNEQFDAGTVDWESVVCFQNSLMPWQFSMLPPCRFVVLYQPPDLLI